MTTKAMTTTTMTLISPNLVDRWINFAQVQESSVKSYTKGIRRLAEYCNTSGAKEFSRAMFLKYREFLTKKYSPSTVNLYLTAAKLFVGFLTQEGILKVNPTEHLKGVKISSGYKKDALSAADTKKILSSFDTSTLKGKRDKAMYALMTTAGLRTIEVARANVGDIVQRNGKFFLYVQGKGHREKDATVRLSAGVFALIQDYLKARADVSEKAPLFASVARRNFGGSLSTVSISRIIKAALRGAGFNSRRLTAHSLRHTAATAALKAGATLREVQQALRHTSIVVTQIYLHDLDRLNNRAECLAASAFGI